MTAPEAGFQPAVAAPAGLAGLIVAETAVGDLRPADQLYTYRQYSALELASSASFEEVWHLLCVGHLPSSEELRTFTASVARWRALPETASEPESGPTPLDDPMADLVVRLAALGDAADIPPLYDDAAHRLSHALALVSGAPTAVAASERRRCGLTPVPSNPELGHVADYLHMLGVAPSPEQVDALTTYLISTMDHGFNASTFASRVVASTGASVTASLTAGLSALSGPLHGGAPSRVLDVLDEIGTEDRISGWVASAVRSGTRVMGFGHAVYRGPDPRAELLRDVALGIGGPRARLAVAFEREVARQLAAAKPDRALAANVELYAAVVLEQCGIPRHLFSVTFAIARMVGWTAHVLEQAEQRKIIRPSARYVGPPMVPLGRPPRMAGTRP